MQPGHARQRTTRAEWVLLPAHWRRVDVVSKAPPVYDAVYETPPLQQLPATKNHEVRAHSQSYLEPESRSQADSAGSIPVIRSHVLTRHFVT
jgi:hypothetical protein